MRIVAHSIGVNTTRISREWSVLLSSSTCQLLRSDAVPLAPPISLTPCSEWSDRRSCAVLGAREKNSDRLGGGLLRQTDHQIGDALVACLRRRHLGVRRRETAIQWR